jgi:hypothetical protein
MTHPIPKSVIASLGITDIDARVRHYANEHAAWRDRESLVAAFNAKQSMRRPEWTDYAGSTDPITEYQNAMAAYEQFELSRPAPFPEPMDHPDIVAAINDKGEPEFEVFDDGPSPAEVLEQKKKALAMEVTAMEHAALEAVVPDRKRRLLNIRLNDLAKTESGRTKDLLNSIGRQIEESNDNNEKLDLMRRQRDLTAEIHAMRTPEEAALAEDQIERQKKIDAITLWAATMHNDIDDLTVDDIDTWKIEPYSI